MLSFLVNVLNHNFTLPQVLCKRIYVYKISNNGYIPNFRLTGVNLSFSCLLRSSISCMHPLTLYSNLVTVLSNESKVVLILFILALYCTNFSFTCCQLSFSLSKSLITCVLNLLTSSTSSSLIFSYKCVYDVLVSELTIDLCVASNLSSKAFCVSFNLEIMLFKAFIFSLLFARYLLLLSMSVCVLAMSSLNRLFTTLWLFKLSPYVFYTISV